MIDFFYLNKIIEIVEGSVINSFFSKKILSVFIVLSGLVPCTYAMTIEANQYYHKACMLGDEAKYQEAVSYLEKAIQLSPSDALLYTKLAGMYSELGEWEQALDNYRKSLKLKPDDAFVYISLGNIYEQTQDYKNALSAYEQALKLFPEYKYNYLNLASVQTHLGQDEEAIKYYQMFLNYYPDALCRKRFQSHTALSSSG